MKQRVRAFLSTDDYAAFEALPGADDSERLAWLLHERAEGKFHPLPAQPADEEQPWEMKTAPITLDDDKTPVGKPPAKKQSHSKKKKKGWFK